MKCNIKNEQNLVQKLDSMKPGESRIYDNHIEIKRINDPTIKKYKVKHLSEKLQNKLEKEEEELIAILCG